MVEAPEPPHQHHHPTGLPWFDFIVPVAVLFISIASLLTSLQSERSMRALVEQNRRLVSAQSTPLLLLDSGNEENGHPILTMKISNVGTGPARVAWFHIVDAQGLDYSGRSLMDRMAKLNPNAKIGSQDISDTLMRSGDERVIFEWPKPTDNKELLAAWSGLNEERFHLHAIACYCSIFEECRITEFGASRPKPVASCDQAASHS